jgi:hypothetical protein
MLFQFYITELHSGAILGTDDLSVAEQYARTEDAFVVDTRTGEWLNPDDSERGYERIEIKAVTTY